MARQGLTHSAPVSGFIHSGRPVYSQLIETLDRFFFYSLTFISLSE